MHPMPKKEDSNRVQDAHTSYPSSVRHKSSKHKRTKSG